jgi:hypothetical protein
MRNCVARAPRKINQNPLCGIVDMRAANENVGARREWLFDRVHRGSHWPTAARTQLNIFIFQLKPLFHHGTVP